MLGRNSGQIRAVAKGVRRTTSRFGARLGSFNMVDVQLHRGRTLDTVTQVETVSAYSDALAEDYASFTNAKLVVETAQTITEGVAEANWEQFDLLHGAIHALASTSRPPALVGTAYLLRAMAIEGWRPELEVCAACGGGEGLLRFSSSGGGVFCQSCAPNDAAAIEPGAALLMQDLLESNWSSALARPAEQWEQVREIAGRWSQWHLEHRLRSLPFATAGAVT